MLTSEILQLLKMDSLEWVILNSEKYSIESETAIRKQNGSLSFETKILGDRKIFNLD